MRFDARRREALALLAAALSMPALARGAVEPKATEAGGPDGASVDRTGFTDLMPGFWAVYDGTLGGDLPTRAQALWERFFHTYDDVYRLAGYRFKQDDVARWLPGFDGRAAATRAVHLRFARDYAGNLGRFRSALPEIGAWPLRAPVDQAQAGLAVGRGHASAGSGTDPYRASRPSILRRSASRSMRKSSSDVAWPTTKA